jgi:hypothetical protein
VEPLIPFCGNLVAEHCLRFIGVRSARESARNQNVKNGEERRNKFETLHPLIKTNRTTTRRRNEWHLQHTASRCSTFHTMILLSSWPPRDIRYLLSQLKVSDSTRTLWESYFDTSWLVSKFHRMTGAWNTRHLKPFTGGQRLVNSQRSEASQPAYI